MGLLKKKVWSVLDIGLLKIGMVLIGAVIGALFSTIVRANMWMLLAIGLLCLIKPTYSYFKD